MFGLRSDGKKAKITDPIQRLVPHIMNSRVASQNFIFQNIDCANLDNFIRNQREQGKSYNYMHVVIATIVRVFYLKPELNRFVVNGRLFDRYAKDGKNITLSITVKKHLSEGAPESIIKYSFTGKETLDEIKELIDKGIRETTSSKEDALKEANKTEKTAKWFKLMPNGLIKFLIGFIKWLDKHGSLPKKLIEVSPFHCSCYLTNMKSLRTDAIYHHLYEFGTTSMFISMGKEEELAVIDDAEEVAKSKIMKLGFTIDERISDGFYFAKALKLFKKYLTNPELLLLCEKKDDL